MDPFSLGIAAASAGLSFFGDRAQSDQALRSRNQQIRIQNRQARIATQLQNQQIRDRNRYAAEEFAKENSLLSSRLDLTEMLLIKHIWQKTCVCKIS